MQVSEYISRIMRNRKIINNLSESQYPYIYRILYQRNESMKNRLLFIFDKAQRTPNQQGDKYGYWFFCSYRKFAEEGKQFAKQKETWQSTLILFTAMGLIHRNIPTEETASTTYEKKAVEAAKQQGREKATSFYTVPEYTEKQLDYIEAKAALWVTKGGNRHRFSKTTVLDVFGSAVGDKVYQDERTKPKRKIEHEGRMLEALLYLLSRDGFTTVDTLKIYMTIHYQQESPYTASETWKRAHHRILQAAGARHHSPNKAEIEAYNLNGNGWIITKL